MSYHLKFYLLVVLRILSWIIIIKTTVDKFTIRQIVSIVTRNYFRKTWMGLNKIHLGPVYSYLIEIFSWAEIFEREIESQQSHNSIWQQNFVTFVPSVTSPFCHSRALTPLCFKVLPARVCSVNLRLLTHTTPLFCFFYFSYFSLKL